MNGEKLTKFLMIDLLLLFDGVLLWYTITTKDIIPIISVLTAVVLFYSAMRVFGLADNN